MKYQEVKERLRLDVHTLRNEIAAEPRPVIYRESLVAALTQLNTILSRDRLDAEELKVNAYSLFRVVTDDWGLESGSFGQRLLEVGRRLEELAKVIPY